MYRGHPLPVGIKGSLVNPGKTSFQLPFPYPVFQSQIQKGQLRGITDTVFTDGSVITENTSFQKETVFLLIQLPGIHQMSVYIALFHRHAVLRQRSCLIGTHCIDRAQRFHRRQTPHNSSHLHHP